MEHWKAIVGFFTVVFGIYKYLDTKNRELDWKKAETVFNLGYTFDSDEDISYAVRLVEGRVSGKKIEDMFDSDGNPNNSDHGEDLIKLDKMLNFLDRIASALQSQTITMKEVSNFGWYFDQVTKISRLHKYCINYGFQDVAKIGKII